jgi:hypothetical protein
MQTTMLSLAAAALFGTTLLVLPEAGPQPTTTPFWQQHGAAPTARDTAAVAALRLAVRPTDTTFAVASR